MLFIRLDRLATKNVIDKNLLKFSFQVVGIMYVLGKGSKWFLLILIIMICQI